MIREVRMDEYEQLMELYLHLHETSVPPAELTRPLWERLVNDPDYHLIAAEEDGKLVSTVTCVIVPNLTHGPRPYAWVENVVTHPDYRGRGLATACLEYAKEIAKRENCYRLILMTGSKLPGAEFLRARRLRQNGKDRIYPVFINERKHEHEHKTPEGHAGIFTRGSGTARPPDEPHS